jgi:hypothetical protein
VSKFFPAKSLAHELEEVDVGNKVWTGFCSIQHLSANWPQLREVTSASIGIPLLAGAGAPASTKHSRNSGGPSQDRMRSVAGATPVHAGGEGPAAGENGVIS